MLVAGVDSSTQSCKVVVVDADSGRLVRHGRAAHPLGTEVDPEAWWQALQQALAEAGGLAGVSALSVGGQQHGMVCLDESGAVVRPAMLWNDTRSAGAARSLVEERGAAFWAETVGSVPVASFTITKLRWLREHEPDAAARVAAVCLPHDWLTWRLLGSKGLDGLVTDRSDASGTGYWSAGDGYRADLFEQALGHQALRPRVLGPQEAAGCVDDVVIGPGAGDNAASALGLGARPGDVIVSVGTSGVACAVSEVAPADPTGLVAGFCDATGRYLPLVATLNAARVLEAVAAMTGVDHAELSRLALRAPAGADGLVLVPYLEGERTPNLPTATGAVHGLTSHNATPVHLARAGVEGMLCGLADGLDALVSAGARPERVLLVGGAAASAAVRQIAPTVFGRPVQVPAPGEYVALGAAAQAAWVLSGSAEPPAWDQPGAELFEADAVPAVRERYAAARALFLERPSG